MEWQGKQPLWHPPEWTDMVLFSYLGGVLIEGGADTTTYFLQSLILCLAAHPEVQKTAREEMDGVVDESRMPTMEDFSNLPYLRAIIKEVRIADAFLSILILLAGPPLQTSRTCERSPWNIGGSNGTGFGASCEGLTSDLY